jgi:hypothetical protein
MSESVQCCSLCKIEQPISNFHIRKKSGKPRKDCKKCCSDRAIKYRECNYERHKVVSKQYRDANKDTINKKISEYRVANKHKRNEYYAKNREKLKAANKASYDKNRDVNIQKRKDWYSNNKDRHSDARSAYAAENKDRLRSARRKWENNRLRNDVDYRLRKKLSGRIREAAKGMYKKSSATEKLIGCDLGAFKVYIESLFLEGMNWGNWAQFGWHIDHKTPLSWFDLSKEEDRAKAFHYTNMQPLWWQDNIKKKNKYSDG